MKNIDFSKIYSYSKLKLFESCPQQYYFNYLDPEIAPIKKQFLKPRDYKVKGQAVHGAITLFYHLAKKNRTFDNLKKCLAQAWFSEKDPQKKMPLGELGGFRNIYHERESYTESLNLLKNFFYIKEPNLKLFYIPTNKIQDSFCDYEEMIKPISQKRYISGKFDRIDKLADNTLRIVDFKTGKKDSDQFQLTFYKLLAELNFDLPVKMVSFYYLNRKEVVDFDLSDINKKSITKEIRGKIGKIEKTKRFPPCFNGLCNHCDFLEICPARKIIRPKTETI
jgi:CRISPR/Cas system-associated exonuclease Cas4 (RecB family)